MIARNPPPPRAKAQKFFRSPVDQAAATGGDVASGPVRSQRQAALLQGTQGDRASEAQLQAAAPTVAPLVKAQRISYLRAQRKAALSKEGLGGEILSKIVKPLAEPALWELRLAARPSHAVAGGVDAAVRGQGIGTILGTAAKGLTGGQQLGFGEVLKDAGVKSHFLRSVGGFAGDVTTDPLNFVTAGTAGIAEHAAEQASRQAFRAAVKAGVAEDTARGLAQTAGEHAAAQVRKTAPDIADNKGLQIGFRAHVPFTRATARRSTSGKLTARLNTKVRFVPGFEAGRPKALTGSEFATAVRKSRGAEATIRDFAPDVKPAAAGAEHGVVMNALRRFRAETHRAQRDAQLEERGIQREIGGTRHGPLKNLRTRRAYRAAETERELVQAGVERAPKHPPAGVTAQRVMVAKPKVRILQDGTVEPVSPAKFEHRLIDASGADYERDVRPLLERVAPEDTGHPELVRNLQGKQKQQFAQEVQAGVQDAKRERPDYFSHKQPQNIDSKLAQDIFRKTPERAGGARKFGPAIERTIQGSNREVTQRLNEAGQPPLFSTDVAAVQAQRGFEGRIRIARRQLVDETIATGRRVRAGQDVTHTDAEAIFKRTKSDALEPVRAKDMERGGEYHVLNRATIKHLNDKLERTLAHHGFVNRKLLGPWKTLATIVSPAYHIGNFVGDMVLAWQADSHIAANFVPALRSIALQHAEIRFKGSAAAARGGRYAKADAALLNVAHEAEKQGALQTGRFGGEISALRGTAPGKVRGFNEARENLPRLISYMSAKHAGMTPEAAAKFVAERHIDYADLSKAEQRIRDIGVPFYTFFARNARLQAKYMLTRPAKAANLELLREDSAKDNGLKTTWENILQTYQKAGAPVVINIAGQNLLLYPKTPIEQGLAPFSGDFLNQLVNRIGPQKLPLEWAVNWDFFTRRNIKKDDKGTIYRPAPSVVASLPSAIQRALGVKKGNDGTLLWNGGADFLAKNVIPNVKAPLDLLSKGTNKYGQTPAMSALSGLAGVKLGPFPGAQQQAESKSIAEYRAVQEKIRVMGQLKQDRDANGNLTPAFRAVLRQYQKLKRDYGRKLDAQARAGSAATGALAPPPPPPPPPP